MNKIKMIVELVKESPSPKEDFRYVLWVFSVLPALFIHESLHILTIILTQCKSHLDFNTWTFLERKKPKANFGNTEKPKTVPGITGFNCPIAIMEENPLKIFLVSISPLLGFPIWIYLSIWIPIHITSHALIGGPLICFLQVYLIYAYEVFSLSQEDKEARDHGIAGMKKVLKKYRRNFFNWKKSCIFALLKFKLNSSHVKEH